MGASVPPVQDPAIAAWQKAQASADPAVTAWHAAQPESHGGGSSSGDGTPQAFGTGSTILNRLSNTITDHTEQVLKGAASPLAARVLSAAQVVPGVEAGEAAMGMAGSHLPGAGPPLSYSESLSALRGETQKIPVAERIGEQMLAGGPFLKFIPATLLSAAKAGALLGAASGAADATPESLTRRLANTAGGAAIGGTVGKVAEMATTAARAFAPRWLGGPPLRGLAATASLAVLLSAPAGGC